MASEAIRVVLCDDHELVRRGIAALLESEGAIEVVGEAGSADEGVAVVAATHPDIVVMDVRMPGRSGVEACREIRQKNPDVRVVILTAFADDEALFAALMAGASGFALKQIRGSELIEAIKKVYEGQSLLDPAVTARVLARLRGESGGRSGEELTPQEKRLVELIAEGLTNRQIGEQMHLAEKTVKNYVSNVLMKLGLNRRAEVSPYITRHRRSGDSQEW